MNRYEDLMQLVEQNEISIIMYPFESNRIKAMCSNGIIALSTKLETENEKFCILLEEYMHILLNTGNITQNSKEEYKARNSAYSYLVNAKSLLAAYKNGCRNSYEIAEFLGITEEFLIQGLKCCKEKYGMSLKIDKYIIYFVPNLHIEEVSEL